MLLELTHQRDESLKNLGVINGEFVIEPTLDVEFDMMIINLHRRWRRRRRRRPVWTIDSDLLHRSPFLLRLLTVYLVIRILFYYWSMNKRGARKRLDLKCSRKNIRPDRSINFRHRIKLRFPFVLSPSKNFRQSILSVSNVFNQSSIVSQWREKKRERERERRRASARWFWFHKLQ